MKSIKQSILFLILVTIATQPLCGLHITISKYLNKKQMKVATIASATGIVLIGLLLYLKKEKTDNTADNTENPGASNPALLNGAKDDLPALERLQKEIGRKKAEQQLVNTEIERRKIEQQSLQQISNEDHIKKLRKTKHKRTLGHTELEFNSILKQINETEEELTPILKQIEQKDSPLLSLLKYIENHQEKTPSTIDENDLEFLRTNFEEEGELEQDTLPKQPKQDNFIFDEIETVDLEQIIEAYQHLKENIDEELTELSNLFPLEEEEEAIIFDEVISTIDTIKKRIYRKTLTLQSPLHTACKKGLITIAQTLLTDNPDLLMKKDTLGKTPLHSACRSSNLELVKWLIEKHQQEQKARGTLSVNIFEKDAEGNTALHDAGYSTNKYIFCYLQKKVGFNPYAQNNAKKMALEIFQETQRNIENEAFLQELRLEGHLKNQ